MDCNEARRFLEAYVDGEIELTRQVDVEAHLVSCGECKKAAEAATKFRHLIKMNTPVYKAPPELKAEVRAALRKISKSEMSWISRLRRPLLYAAAILIVCLLCVGSWIATSENKERVLIAQAISNHSHSLLADHLLDLSASDRHVLKTWFTGRLDYSPPLADLSEAGYKLVGGRLDILENRPVAAIVYSHQDHVINEFVWPAVRRTIDFDVQSHQGFSMCGWSKSGFNYLIVSDLSQANMETFEDQIRERSQ
jgi:anti-sigma factor (TIGR02949 family)